MAWIEIELKGAMAKFLDKKYLINPLIKLVLGWEVSYGSYG